MSLVALPLIRMILAYDEKIISEESWRRIRFLAEQTRKAIRNEAATVIDSIDLDSIADGSYFYDYKSDFPPAKKESDR